MYTRMGWDAHTQVCLRQCVQWAAKGVTVSAYLSGYSIRSSRSSGRKIGLNWQFLCGQRRTTTTTAAAARAEGILAPDTPHENKGTDWAGGREQNFCLGRRKTFCLALQNINITNSISEMTQLAA